MTITPSYKKQTLEKEIAKLTAQIKEQKEIITSLSLLMLNDHALSAETIRSMKEKHHLRTKDLLGLEQELKYKQGEFSKIS